MDSQLVEIKNLTKKEIAGGSEATAAGEGSVSSLAVRQQMLDEMSPDSS